MSGYNPAAIHFPKPPKYDAPLKCRIWGHKWFDCSDGWFCWRCSKAVPDYTRFV